MQTAPIALPTSAAQSGSVSQQTSRTPALVVWAALTALVIAAGVAFLAGFRVFVVDTPSMGRAAPVGSLVIGTPAPTVTVGDVITYRRPGGSDTYTHRVVAVGATGYTTRGDVNGADDPWPVTQSMVISRASAIVPGVGWLVRAAPVLLLAALLLHAARRRLRSREVRANLTLIGGAVAFGVTSLWLRPFTGFVVQQSQAEQGGLRATVVSTALLPLRVSARDGGELRLHPGEVGEILLPSNASGRVSMMTSLDLGALGWVAIVLLCCAPIVWALTYRPTSAD